MANDERMTKSECRRAGTSSAAGGSFGIFHRSNSSVFVVRISFVILHFAFVIHRMLSRNVAKLNRLVQRRHFIPHRDELLPDIPLVARFHNGLHEGSVINLLGIVELAAARHAGGVIMADVWME